MTQVVVVGSIAGLEKYRHVSPDLEEMAAVLASDEKTIFVAEGLEKGFWRKVRDFFRRSGLNWTRTVLLFAERDPEASGIGLEDLIDLWTNILDRVSETPYITFNVKKRVSRRVLVRFGPSALIEYTGVPTVRRSKCVSLAYCMQCIDSCPYGAMSGKPPTIDPQKCTECGLCVSACPSGLIVNPVAPENFLEVLVVEASERGIGEIVFTCPYSREEVYEKGMKGLVVELPCVASLPLWLISLSRRKGVKTSTYCSESSRMECGRKEAYILYQRTLAELERAFAPEPLKTAEPVAGRGAFAPHARGVDEWVSLTLPIFFRVSVSEEKCTLCGVCAEKCPVDALEMKHDEKGYTLIFKHERCNGCTLCENVCPEKAIKVSRAVNPSWLGVEKTLAYSPPARCIYCGRDIGPEKKIALIERRLRDAGAVRALSMVRVCRECKSRKMLGELIGGRG